MSRWPSAGRSPRYGPRILPDILALLEGLTVAAD